MAHKLVTSEMVMTAYDVFERLYAESNAKDWHPMDDEIRAALEAVADDLIAVVEKEVEEKALGYHTALAIIRSFKSQGQ